MAYPGTKWFIGREELKRLRESTLITFYKVCKMFGIRKDIDFKYNGSRIDLLDLRFLPSDPLYERYGSIEYTGGWIDEGGENLFPKKELFEMLTQKTKKPFKNYDEILDDRIKGKKK